MTFDDFREWAAMAWEIAQPWAQPVLFGAGAVGTLLSLLLLWRFLTRGEAHAKLGTVAVTLATAFAMEGMYEVAHGPLGLNVAGSLMFCATFEVVMLHQGTLAAHKLAKDPTADIRRHMSFVWLVAGASGVIASTASDSITEVVLRLATPPLAAGIWYMSLYADRQPAERQPTRWIWTPERLGVRLGLLKPGAIDDLADVFRQRTVTAMVISGVVVWNARKAGDTAEKSRRALRHAQRLERLARTADETTLTAAHKQLAITLGIQSRLFAGIGPDGAPEPADDRVLAELERIRRETREATGRLREQHRAAFGGHAEQPRIPSVPFIRSTPLATPPAAPVATPMATIPAQTVATSTAPAGHANGHHRGQDDADLMAIAMATADPAPVATTGQTVAIASGQQVAKSVATPSGQTDRGPVATAVAARVAKPRTARVTAVATTKAKAGNRQPDRYAEIKRIAARMPKATEAEIAAKAGCSVSTLRRALGKKS